MIEHYTDGTPDVVSTYNVENGQPFSGSYGSTGTIQGFQVSAADAGVQADFAARTLGIDSVTRDITITLTFGEGSIVVPPDEHTVTVTEVWADGSQTDRVTTQQVADGAAFYRVFPIPGGYSGSMTYTGSATSYNTGSGALYMGKVDQDAQVTITYTPAGAAPDNAEVEDDSVTATPLDPEPAPLPEQDEELEAAPDSEIDLDTETEE